jgi:hypothetical protein
LNWYRVGEFFSITAPKSNDLKIATEALALEQSSAGSMFWSPEQMKDMVDELATAGKHSDLSLRLQIVDQKTEELARLTGVVSTHGVAICGA